MDAQELQRNLKQFTGTDGYTRHTHKVVLTDGVVYLAENAACYWLLDLFASYLHYISNEEFTCLKLVRKNQSATVTIDDGNGNVLATQFVEYTDFVLENITLYGCWSGEYWVVMLTSEY